MPGTYNSPGTFVAEVPYAVKVVDSLPTGVAAFVGSAVNGPLNEPTLTNSFDAFKVKFGGLDPSSDLSYAVAQYFENGGNAALIIRVDGSASAAPSVSDIVGSAEQRTGLHSLSPYGLFDLLVVPNRTESEIHTAMVKVASECGAFAILDLPESVNSPPRAKEWIDANEALRSPNAAAYFPRLIAQDPTMGGMRRSFANSGVIAGIFARNDATKGVWATPAGTTAGLTGVQGLTYKSSEQEIALLRSLGLNVLRGLPGVGPIIWGARTLAWPNHIFGYVPVSRLRLFLVRHVHEVLLWTDFSRGGETLREELRIEFDLFMRRLFVQGAFWGTTRGRAYDVSCYIDGSGVAIVTLGFATLATGEFISLAIPGPPPFK